MGLRKSELAAAIKPFVLGWIGAIGGAIGEGGYAPSPHDLNSAHHSGSLADSQAPQFLKTDGSRSLLGSLTVADYVTIDGVDVSALNSNFTTHDAGTAHAQHDSGVGVHTHQTNPEGGQLDHGAALTGLGDDDHTIYASAEGSGTRRAYEAGRLNKSITAGTGLTGGGLMTVDRTLAVDLNYAFTWGAMHTFDAGARIAAGQNLQFGTDVALSRAGADVLGLASGDAFRSTSYASGVSGWAIDASGDAEFNNVRVRGALTTAIFIKGLIEARAGSELITKSAGLLSDDMAVPGSGTWYAYIEDPPGGGFLFENGDICRCKTEYASGIGDIWFIVSSRTDMGNGRQRYTCTYASGTRSITYPAGAPVVDYGVSGDGGLLLTADDAVGNAPFLSVFTHAGSPWSTLTERLRLGNLNGLADYSSDAYGAFIGDYAGDKWLAYDPANSLRIRGDALIEGTVTADKLQIGDHGLFSLTGGALLLGPYGERAYNYWRSTRGPTMAIVGSHHTVQGRWQGTRAQCFETAETNILTNPSAETSLTNWFYWFNSGSGATGSQSRSSTRALYGDWSVLTNVTNGGSGVLDVQVWTIFSATAGQPYTGSMGVWCSKTCSVLMQILQDASPYTVYTSQYVTVSPGWNRFTLGVASATATETLRLSFGIGGNGALTFYMDGAQVIQKAYDTSYIDGDQGYGYAWTGTAHASTSTRAASYGNLDDQVGLLNDQAALSFRVVFQAPTDWDGDWSSPSASYLLLAINSGGTATGSVTLEYDGNNQRFESYINGATRIATSGVEFSKGDWIDAFLTLDFTADEYILYINGEVEGTSTDSLSAPSGLDYFRLGGNNAGAGQGGFAVAEFAVFHSVVDAEAVKRAYNLGIPLVDNGAMETPGIYILDGDFRIASSSSGNRIEIDATEIALYDANDEKQVWIHPTDGVNFLQGTGDLNAIHWRNTSEEIAAIYGTYAFNTAALDLGAWPTGAGDDAEVTISGIAPTTNLAAVWLKAQSGNQMINFVLQADDTGAPTVDLTGSDLRVEEGLFVGRTTVDPDTDDIWCDGEISTNGGSTRWDLGGFTSAGDAASNGYVTLAINGVSYKLMTRA